jgi:hypothetical protein
MGVWDLLDMEIFLEDYPTISYFIQYQSSLIYTILLHY